MYDFLKQYLVLDYLTDARMVVLPQHFARDVSFASVEQLKQNTQIISVIINQDNSIDYIEFLDIDKNSLARQKFF